MFHLQCKYTQNYYTNTFHSEAAEIRMHGMISSCTLRCSGAINVACIRQQAIN